MSCDTNDNTQAIQENTINWITSGDNKKSKHFSPLEAVTDIGVFRITMDNSDGYPMYELHEDGEFVSSSADLRGLKDEAQEYINAKLSYHNYKVSN